MGDDGRWMVQAGAAAADGIERLVLLETGQPVETGGGAVGDRLHAGKQRRRHAAGGERRPYPADGEHLADRSHQSTLGDEATFDGTRDADRTGLRTRRHAVLVAHQLEQRRRSAPGASSAAGA